MQDQQTMNLSAQLCREVKTKEYGMGQVLWLLTSTASKKPIKLENALYRHISLHCICRLSES